MDISEFMRKWLTKEDIKDIAHPFDFKKSGTKDELISRIVSDPDFELDDIQRGFYKESLQRLCRTLDLKVSGTKDELWDSVVDELGLTQAKVRQKPAQAAPITQSKASEYSMRGMNAREFMRKNMPSYDFRSLVRKFKLDPSETRAQLIDQIVANPEFELADLNRILTLGRMKSICRDLNLRVSGSKDELWGSIVEALGLEHGKEEKPPQFQIAKASIRGFMQKYLTVEYLKEIISEYPVKQTGKKEELIDRLIGDPEFELHDVYFAMDSWVIQETCRKLRLPVSGNKEELWGRILQKLEAEKPEKKKVVAPPSMQTTDLDKSIVQIIREWVPAKRHRTEGEYQTELRSLLEYKHNYSVKEEAGSTQVDILVENEIPIELKKNPNRGDFDRLSGQIVRHIEAYGKLVIVLCQLQTRDLFNEYKNRFEEQYSSDQLIWIEK
ncbi:MAG: hypothetical protein ACE5OZ_10670 [Candidatus Heimdallarchaeota archaeon]